MTFQQSIVEHVSSAVANALFVVLYRIQIELIKAVPTYDVDPQIDAIHGYVNIGGSKMWGYRLTPPCFSRSRATASFVHQKESFAAAV